VCARSSSSSFTQMAGCEPITRGVCCTVECYAAECICPGGGHVNVWVGHVFCFAAAQRRSWRVTSSQYAQDCVARNRLHPVANTTLHLWCTFSFKLGVVRNRSENCQVK
jgi:hypothetical protein